MRVKRKVPTSFSRHLRLLVVFFFCHVVCFAHPMHGQNIVISVRDTRISLDVKKLSLREVFLLIEQKTGISIGYNATAVNAGQIVNYKADGVMLSSVLQQLLSDYEGSVKQVDNRHIFLKVEKKKAVAEKPVAVAEVAAPLVTITGTVTDENNQPVPGVSIHEKTSKKNTTTDANGKYSISANAGDVLVFNFIGYTPQEVTIGEQSVMNVQLKIQNSQLKEIVAIGYQSVRKSDLTGAVSSVKSSELNLSAPTVGQALVGKVAGVSVAQTSGAPYASTKIRVRGIGSVNAGTQPLYVVDGYPTDNDIFINPEDVESIDILKDAASAAIYGSRAAGGVVIITTKRGKEGKGKFEYDFQTGINQLAKKVKLMNADEFTQLMVDARNNSYHDYIVNAGKPWNDGMYSDDNDTRVLNSPGNGNAIRQLPEFYDFANQKMIKPKYNTDWQDEIYRNAFFARHNLSFSGGKDNVRYYISGGYQNQDGIILNTGVKKINLRANIDGKVSEKLKVGLNVSMSNNQNKETEEGRWDHNPIMAALLMLPSYRAYDEKGNIAKNEVAALSSTYGFNSFENPIAIAKEINIRRNGNRGTYNAYAVYQLLPALSFKANLGLQTYSEKFNYYYPTSLSAGVNAPYSVDAKNAANAKANSVNYVDKLGEYTLNYNRQIRKHKFDALAGYTVQKTNRDVVKVQAKGFDNDRVQDITGKGADAAFFTLQEATNTTTTLISYLARINYNYDGKYFLTGSFRTDGSSRFGPENKWGTFPSVAAGWTISNESFYHDWLGKNSTLKLRASWGLSGNNNIGDYNHQQVMGTATGTVIGGNIVNATLPGSIRDRKLGWESTSQYNAGLDVGLFNGRVNVIANYYESYSFNLLFDQPISAISGSNTMLTNLRDSKIRNRGIDVQIDTRIIDGKDFRLNASGNISLNRNKVLDLGGASTILTAGAERSYKTHITQTGQPVGMFYGFRVLGVATEKNYNTVAPSSAASNPMHPGDLYFYDKTGDGVVNDADKDVIGNPYPKFTYGFNITASYKDLYFSSSFNGSYGNQVLDGQDYYLYNMEGSGNQYADAAGHYRNAAEPGNGYIYRPSRAGTQSNSTRLSTFYLQDASFFRCTNLTLGYNLKLAFLQRRLGVSRATVFASVDNAFTITKYKGYNPEVDFNLNNTSSANNVPGSTNNSNLAPGVDYGMYPLVRAYNAGVKVAF